MAKQMLGLVALSFGLREEEPSPTNLRLADAVLTILASEQSPVIVVSQWEVTRGLRLRGYEPALSVGLRDDGAFLGSEDVIDEAAAFFHSCGVSSVIPVSQVGLHRYKVNRLLKSHGFNIEQRPVGRIGFDPDSTLWWTRGPVRLASYAALQRTVGLHGHFGKQLPTRRLTQSRC